MKSIGYSLAGDSGSYSRSGIRPRRQVEGDGPLRTATEHLKEREREASGRILKIREDHVCAESLREELERDIALCERRIRELGGQGKTPGNGPLFPSQHRACRQFLRPGVRRTQV